MAQFPAVIHLNVGGTVYATKLETLCKYSNSRLERMFNGQKTPDKDKDGCYFIDRSGKYFEHILNYLREDSYRPPIDEMKAVMNEAIYFDLLEYSRRMQQIQQQFPAVIHLNVGGTLYVTKLETLLSEKGSWLERMFNGQNTPDKDKDGNYFIDRNGKYFDHILEFLRVNAYRPPFDIVDAVKRDAEYFRLKDYVGYLRKM